MIKTLPIIATSITIHKLATDATVAALEWRRSALWFIADWFSEDDVDLDIIKLNLSSIGGKILSP